jgi:Cupredoxin-like domain
MLFIEPWNLPPMGSGARAGLVLAGGLLFTGALAIATQYNMLAIALGGFGSILFALREGFVPGTQGAAKGGERTPTGWLWFVLGVALMLLTLTPIFGAYSVTAAPSGGSSSSPSAGGGGQATNCGNPCVIQIRNSQFGSGTQLKGGNGYIVIKAGTTVTWENKDSTQHTTTSTASPALWDSGILSPGQSFSHTFNTPGTFPYICNVHPMAGTVVVVS